MSALIEIIVPTFISPHLFWIIEKKNILIRNAFEQIADNDSIIKKKVTPNCLEDLYWARVNNTWVRVEIDSDLYKLKSKKLEENQYLCWLVDYGVMKVVETFYQLPNDLKQCPKLAKKASLFNIVNCEMIIEGIELKRSFRKVLYPLTSITRLSLSLLNGASKYLFNIEDEINGIFYGDIVYYKKDEEYSLTEQLVDQNIMAVDEKLFEQISYRDMCKETYFQSKFSWKKPLDTAGKLLNRSDYIFEEETNDNPFEFFKRKIDSNKIEKYLFKN